MWLSGRSDAAGEAALPLPLEIRSIRTARRMRLRIDERRRVLKLTCPTRTSRKAAVRWVLEQRSWIERQLAAMPAGEPFAPGSLVPIEGVEVRLVHCPVAPRTGRLEGGELRIGGPPAGFERRVEAFLRRHALGTMSAEVAAFAGLAGLAARAVAVGDAATRWGSCSAAGRIRLNWRLIMAPVEVRRYVVAHEVAHLRHLDHGRDFRALEKVLVGPGLAEAKSALRLLGPRLRLLGRGQ